MTKHRLSKEEQHQTIIELRKRTGCGVFDCKKALYECDFDIDKAVDYIKEHYSGARRCINVR